MTVSAFYREIGLENSRSALHKKLDKKIFYEYAELNKQEKDVITKFIERMELAYLLTPKTINIQPFINEEHHYEGIMYVSIELRDAVTDKQVRIIEEIIHSALPNPVVIVFQLFKQVLISTCMKRLNKVDKSNVVLGVIHHTTWINIENGDSLTTEFFRTIHLQNISFVNFFVFYKEIDLAVEAIQNAEIVGSFQVVNDVQQHALQQELIEEITRLEQEISKLKSKIKKESQFNKKVEYNVKIQQLVKKVTEIKQRLVM